MSVAALYQVMGMDTMGSPLTHKSTDRSDTEKFAFSFFCDQCGKEWLSPAVSFETGGFTAIEHELTRQLIWEQEHRAAFEQANLEAHFQFSYCPKCGKRVCYECFDAEGEHEGVCRECSGK